ncbi:RNA-binding protein 39 [Phytophthora cinnamomi]|uniref:RNA-binding protein 39 n=1 Tax=Phytophthora cinnamomi TaxID=4785 RepID=UPI00355AC450|nr:RNA-binding protein 39 [Phytophthora cinnamomi]
MADEAIESLLQEGIQAAAKNAKRDSRPEEEGSLRRSRRRSRSRSHSRRRHRDRSRSRSKSRRRSRRSRSRSPRRSRGSRRDRGRSRSRSRERTSRRRHKSKSRSRSAPKKEERERSTSAERAERAKQRELMELTRDHRTVFVGQLTQKVREKDLDRFLSKTGKVENVLLIRDKFTNRSKGFAYVELSNLEDVPKVLLLNGQVPDFQVFPIMIKASEAEKNFAAKKDSVMNAAATATTPLTADAPGAGLAGAIAGGGMSASALSAASRIYCGNLHTNITEDDLRIVFQSFGEVLSVTINRDEMGRSKGFSFIQFSSPQEANFALSKGNGLELAGNYLRLGPVNENAMSGGNRSMGGAGSGADNNATGGRWKLEDDEGTGLSMNAQSRSALMAKLAGNDVNLFPTGMGGNAGGIGGYPAASTAADYTNSMAATAAQRAEQAAALMSSTEIEGSESFCFVVKNMFDVYQEQKSGNPEWAVEIQQDVEEECGQYGPVLHTYVENEKQGGLVYVLFANVGGAVAAAKKLHGRWFNKRQISVRYLSSQEYVGMFPEARSAVQTARANSSQ